MKKSLLALILTSLLLASCSIFGKLSEIDYNNQVVDQINLSSKAIGDSATLYNETVPDLVTETSSIETTEMNASYTSAMATLSSFDTVQSLESRNVEQQNAIRNELETYESAAIDYLETYKEMLDYYESDTYTEDLSRVETLDEKLHASYTTFIQANNSLVDILESFVSSK